VPFTLDHTDAATAARAGRLDTAHGPVDTPVFMPVGTAGSVKAVSPRVLRSDVDAQMILGNTYHLFLRPGLDVIEGAGGLHPFMGWDGPLLTDSGGYQVFSLGELVTLSEEGVEFKNHIDGDTHLFTPESVVDTQRVLGPDVMMVLDECPSADVSKDYARRSHELTLRWAERARDQFVDTALHYDHEQALFGIVQGGLFPDLRRASARRLVDLGFPGYAIGGLSVGEPHETMYEMIEVTTAELPADRPRYLMGVGTPANLLEAIARGVDLFDCVMPTRNGRNGQLFTTEGILNIKNAQWTDDHSPVDPGLDTYASRHFTKAYVRHLVVHGEILGLQIASQQNLAFYCWLLREARAAIRAGRFGAWKDEVQPRVSRRL
jgi:queuine tRNA-ribosyltransferase